MKREKQQAEIDIKILRTVQTFLEEQCSMNELSHLTGYSKSSVQRYLNDHRIIAILGQEEYDQIQSLLAKQVVEARRKGGMISQSLHGFSKEYNGQFRGSGRK